MALSRDDGMEAKPLVEYVRIISNRVLNVSVTSSLPSRDRPQSKPRPADPSDEPVTTSPQQDTWKRSRVLTGVAYCKGGGTNPLGRRRFQNSTASLQEHVAQDKRCLYLEDANH